MLSGNADLAPEIALDVTGKLGTIASDKSDMNGEDQDRHEGIQT